MSLDLITIEHSSNPEVLLQPAALVSFPLSNEDKEIITHLKQHVLALNGVGLAAPQIGIAKQILVFAISSQAKSLRADAHEVIMPTILINPTYEPAFDAKVVADWEACFSVAEITGKVPRYDKIHYRAYDEEGHPIQATACGFSARVLQHEIDHLQGILIIHRLTPDSIQGHPHEMLSLRYQEFNPEQKTIFKKMLQETINKTDSRDEKKAAWINKVKQLLTQDE